MNTIYYYILQGLFTLLYLVEFTLWYRLTKYESYREFPKSKHFRFVPLYVAAVITMIIAGAFITDDPVKFRLMTILILITPVISIQIKNVLAYISVVNEFAKAHKPELNLLRLRCLLFLKSSILFYAVLIPLLIIYLK